MSDERLHPTPWVVGDYTNAAGIYDANRELVETVYGRLGDPTGIETAQRIADAVNKVEGSDE